MNYLPIKVRVNTVKKIPKNKLLFLEINCDPEGISSADPTKLRFENSTNKKTLKQAWRFFLLYYLFMTQAYESSNFVENFQKLLML